MEDNSFDGPGVAVWYILVRRSRRSGVELVARTLSPFNVFSVVSPLGYPEFR